MSFDPNVLIDNHQPVVGNGYRGNVINELAGAGPNWARLRRPYLDDKYGPCVTINAGRWTVEKGERRPVLERVRVADLVNNHGISLPVFNATTLRADAWREMDKVILKSARQRLRAWADLAGRNTYGGFNAMGKAFLEHETMSDPGEAVVDMDGLTEGRADTPRFQLEGLPLPITHSDFWFSSRQLESSRTSGTPLDTTMGEAAGRRVGESVEKVTIGVDTGISYGGTGGYSDGRAYSRSAQVFGYTNFTNRNTKTDLTTPTGSNPEGVLQDVLEMRQLMFDDFMYGPYILYHSTSYDQFLDNDYARLGGNNANTTLRDRIRAVEGIEDVRRLDFLTSGYQLILVQMTGDVARAVVGMNITTVQWESVGGLRLNFKVMAILVPQLRADFSNRCGIVHATTS